MPTDAPSYLDPATIASVGSIDLRARMIVEGLMTGMHRSPMQGFSVEFAQHRQYVPGDDTRFLDWKVFGRTDKLYLKQHHKETNLDLVALVDCSGSMAYASPETRKRLGRPWRKFDHAATLAAVVCHLALKQQDRVQLVMFDEDVVSRSRLSNAAAHWRDVVQTLENAPLPDPDRAARNPPAADGEALGRTSLARTFDRVLNRLTQRSLILLVSDLMDDPEAIDRGLARAHHRRHDVMIVQVLDVAERTFPFRAPSEFIGLESEGRLPINPEALKRAYLDTMRRHLRETDEAARRFQFDLLRTDTTDPVGPPLSHFLAKRASAIGKRS